MADAWLYDGETALRHAVSIWLERDVLRIARADGGATSVPLAAMVRREDVAGDAILGRRDLPGWRLILPGGVPADLAAALPAARRYGGVIDRIGLWPAAAAFAVLAGIALALFLNSPPLVARAIPRSIEQRLGELMVGDFGKRGCATPAGDAALAALVQRVDPDDPMIEVSVVRVPIVNAVTLPGGRIVLFDGLVQAARSPDEVAGVIGHEIGHVRHRDVMESLVRQFGLSVLLGGMEGNVGGYTNTLLASAYSRKAEARADDQAIGLLRDAQISPAPTAAFFTRLGGKDAKAERMFAYLASHPVSADRARRFTRSLEPEAQYRPTLDPAQWQALRGMCAASPKEENGWRF